MKQNVYGKEINEIHRLIMSNEQKNNDENKRQKGKNHLKNIITSAIKPLNFLGMDSSTNNLDDNDKIVSKNKVIENKKRLEKKGIHESEELKKCEKVMRAFFEIEQKRVRRRTLNWIKIAAFFVVVITLLLYNIYIPEPY